MKHFVKNQTRKELKMSIKTFAKSIGIKKVTYNNKALYIEGSYNHKTRVIFLSSRLKKENILPTFFHELAHHIACKRGLWKIKDSCCFSFYTRAIILHALILDSTLD